MNEHNTHQTKGDINHPFIAALKHLMETGAQMRAHVLYARKLVIHGSAMGWVGRKTRDFSAFTDVDPDNISQDGKIIYAIQTDRLTSLIRGNRVPTAQEIETIAADYNLDGNTRQVFIDEGLDYINHCTGLQPMERQNQFRKLRERKSIPASKKEPVTELQGVLFDMINSRWFERRTGEIFRDKFSTEVVPLRVTHLQVSYELSHRQQSLLRGTRPDPTRKFNLEGDKAALEDLLVILDATVDEEQRALAAFQRDIETKKTKIPQTMQRDTSNSLSALG